MLVLLRAACFVLRAACRCRWGGWYCGAANWCGTHTHTHTGARDACAGYVQHNTRAFDLRNIRTDASTNRCTAKLASSNALL